MLKEPEIRFNPGHTERRAITENVLTSVDFFIDTYRELVHTHAATLDPSKIARIEDIDGPHLDKFSLRMDQLTARNDIIGYLKSLDQQLYRDTFWQPGLAGIYGGTRNFNPDRYPDLNDMPVLEQWQQMKHYEPFPDLRRLVEIDNRFISLRNALENHADFADDAAILAFYNEMSAYSPFYASLPPVDMQIPHYHDHLKQQGDSNVIAYITGTPQKHSPYLLRNKFIRQLLDRDKNTMLYTRDETIVPKHSLIDPWKAAIAGLYANTGLFEKVVVLDDTPFQTELIDYLRQNRPDFFGTVHGLIFNQYVKKPGYVSWQTYPQAICDLVSIHEDTQPAAPER